MKGVTASNNSGKKWISEKWNIIKTELKKNSRDKRREEPRKGWGLQIKH